MDYLTRQDLEIALAPRKADLLLLKWSTGFIVGGIIAPLLKGIWLVLHPSRARCSSNTSRLAGGDVPNLGLSLQIGVRVPAVG
jgi:hypothetical protein